MGFQIVEFQIDRRGAEKRFVAPQPFATRQEAQRQIQTVIEKYERFGYEPENDHWWFRAQNGDRSRLVIEAV